MIKGKKMDCPNLQKMRILLVEDDETTSEVIYEILHKRVKELYRAADGESGLEIYKSKNPDIIITDIKMPKMNGLNMAEEIKGLDEDARIVVATSLFDHNILVRAMNIGITAFMHKPIETQKILEILEKQASFSLAKKEYAKNKKLLEEYKHAVDEGSIVSKTDAEGTITYVNDEFCKISGYNREELIGQNHNILRHPDMSEEVFEDLWSTIIEQSVWKGKVKNRRKDGSTYVVNATIVPIINVKGKTVEYLGLRQDVTELELLNENLEKRVAQEVEKNNQKDKALIHSLESIHDASPNPIIVYQHGKVTFANKRFVHISGLNHSALIDQKFDLSSIFEKRQGFIADVNGIDKSVDTNKVSVAGKNGRNIFYVIENTVDLPMDESFEMFTFNNITLSEYQKIKVASYNSRLEDFIKGMGRKAKNSTIAKEKLSVKEVETLDVPVEIEATEAAPKLETKSTEPEEIESETPEKGRVLSGNERNVLKRTRLNSEISSADYAAEIDDYVLEEMQELGELEVEITEVISAFLDEKDVKPLHLVSSKLTKYASTINQLFEFGDLAFSVVSLASLLMTIKNEDLTDIKIRKIELFLSNILLDMSNWRTTIFVDQSANDIHYLDASLFSAILQLELVLNEGQKIEEEEDDDFELF